MCEFCRIGPHVCGTGRNHTASLCRHLMCSTIYKVLSHGLLRPAWRLCHKPAVPVQHDTNEYIGLQDFRAVYTAQGVLYLVRML